MKNTPKQGSAGAYYENGQVSYYYINADAAYTPGFDYWIYDATTGEHSPINQPNLGTWVDLRPPTLDSASHVGTAGVSLGYHFNSDYASDVVVERRLADLSEPWTEVAWAQLGGAMYGASYQIENHGLHPGDVYLFRMRTRFGELRSEPSNELAFSPDGYLSNGFYSIQASLMGQSVSAARLEWTTDGPIGEGAYEVQMRNGTSGAWTTLGTVAADAFDEYVQVGETGCHVYSFQPIGLVPGRNYFFRVRLVRPSDDHFENPSPVATMLAPVDSDGDGIPDAQEIVMGTNPNAADSDGDGYSDGEELAAGTNPNDAAGHPNYHGSGTVGGGGGTTPPLPSDPDTVPEIPILNYASLDLTELTGVKATGGIALGDDGKIAFYENAGSHYKVAVWSPDGSFKVGSVPIFDPQGAPLYVVGINSEGMLAGNSRGYNKQRNRTIPVAFKAFPNWNSAGASIVYPFKNANEDCFEEVNVAPCGQPEELREVALPSAVIGVSGMDGPWGTNTGFVDWKYQCEACCGGYSEETLAEGYYVWNQVFYGSGVVMPAATANIAQADTDMDGLDDAEVSSLQITYSPSPYLASLSDVSFNGASPYGEWRSGESFSASGGPSATSHGYGFAPNQNGLPSVEMNKTNDAPQGVNGANLVTSAVAEAQSKVPSEFQDYVKIFGIRDNGNGDVLLADAHVWTVGTEGEEPHWVERIVRLQNSAIEVLVAGASQPKYIGQSTFIAGMNVYNAVLLLPVEVLIKAPNNLSVKKHTEKLCVATLEAAFGGANFSLLPGFMENERDSFYIRVKNPLKIGVGKITVKISTESEAAEYSDPAHEIELIETPANSGSFISPAQILVSNEVDDVYSSAEVANDEILNDPTHKIALGGKVIVEVDPRGGSNYQRKEIATVPIEKTVKIKPIIIKAGVNNNPVISDVKVALDMKTLRETFAQCGVKNEVRPSVQIDEDEIADFGLLAGISTNQNAASLTVEESNLFSHIGAKNIRSADEVSIIYVNYLTVNAFPYGEASCGQAYVEKDSAQPKAVNANHVILSADSKFRFTVAHELLHILLDALHRSGAIDYPTEFSNPRMAWSGGNDEIGIFSRKGSAELSLHCDFGEDGERQWAHRMGSYDLS